MELAMGTLGSLAPKVAKLLKDEYVKQKGLKPDIETLSRELLMMHAALTDISQESRGKLPAVYKLWARSVRELAYDMEDAIDTFWLLAARSEPTEDDLNVFKKIGRKAVDILKNLKDRRQLANRAKQIKNLSKELPDLSAKYRCSGTNSAASASMDPRLLNMYKSEADLVGIEEARDEVIRRLAVGDGSDKSLKIVSIVGFAGLGKTTLAKTVHDRLKEEFECSAFVAVGRNPLMTSVLEKLLNELDEKKYSDINTTRWDVEQFSNELHKFLQHRR